MHQRSAASAALDSPGDRIRASEISLPAGIYARGGKRVFDFVLALVGLIFLAPLLLVIACAVRLTSRGPVFFRQIRVGKRGRPFRILKFRSMSLDAGSRGAVITAAGDPRITPLGRILRHYKLDELPQLWNVLRGEMSLVGPRPELPIYVERYTGRQKAVLDVRPGITGPDALAYRDEEALLAATSDSQRCYESVILPDKLALDLEYLNRITAYGDLKILLGTMASLVRSSRSAPIRSGWKIEEHLGDLLERESLQIDLKSAGALIAGRSVLVTGAAGSIGSELCSQIVSLNPARIVCLDRNRAGIHRLRHALDRGCSPARVSFVVADVGDRRAVRDCLAGNEIDFIFHAAAHKHLPALESDVAEAVRNNVFALEVLLQAAEDASCRSFVLISSDKAVNPSSVMGATKRIGEFMLASRPQSTMRCVTVRFGNVLGSSGSVVPILYEQLSNGAPLTITHRESKRFFMTAGEAASLALEAFAIGRHGEILVLDMGAPVKIVDLARKMAGLLQRDESSVEIRYTGLRPGEKLEEELFYAHEIVTRTADSRIWRAQGECPSSDKLCLGFRQLHESVNSGDPEGIRAALREIVPEYSSEGFGDRPTPITETVLAIVQTVRDEPH